MCFIFTVCKAHVLCISTSFRVLAAPESWSKQYFKKMSFFRPAIGSKFRCLTIIGYYIFGSLYALKWRKKGWKTAEKMFRPAFGWAQHPKTGQNTQQTSIFTTWNEAYERLFLGFLCMLQLHSLCIKINFLNNFS